VYFTVWSGSLRSPGLSFQRIEGSKDLLMQRCWAPAKTCGSKMDGLSVSSEIMKSA